MKLFLNETYNYSARGAFKRDKGDFDGAKEDYKKALEIEPNNKGAKKNLDILAKNGNNNGKTFKRKSRMAL